MSESYQRWEYSDDFYPSARELRIPLHVGLLVITFLSTTMAGVQWIGKDPFELSNFAAGLPYSISLLVILGSHELGHFFYSMKHRVKATLPYFIPFPIIPGMLTFGTLGAVIRTKTPVPSRRAIFDIGVSGPIIGWLLSVVVLILGFTHLPSKEYLLRIHPNYNFRTNTVPGTDGIPLAFGGTIIFRLLEFLFTNPHTEFIPPLSEIYHYPFLCVGWFGLFVTAMNLLPVGQLDGGHTIYAMFPKAHRKIARTFFILIMAIGLLGLLPLIGIYSDFGWTGWLFWGLILFFVVRLDHPPVFDPTPIDTKRKIVGWLTILIFVVSFSPTPFIILSR